LGIGSSTDQLNKLIYSFSLISNTSSGKRDLEVKKWRSLKTIKDCA